jgi:hypothetical protein
MVYRSAARYNSKDHFWTFPNGEYVQLGQLESHADYRRYQGRSFTMLQIDGAGQFADASLLDLLRSNRRGPKDIPIRMVMAANPGGTGHHWLAHRFVSKAEPWAAFDARKSKRTWVYAPSMFAGNQFIDRAQYADRLQSACPDDPELLRAWKDGYWAVNRGAYVASVLDEKRNAVDNWDALPDGWDTFGGRLRQCGAGASPT